ncbi:VOC family protein [Janthinobacterium fluminis]|uniref:VOC family protein n=1 Tax=Janthinobacterium fluminis TaxID=2987524 RepID=A0ABT5K699_9BURK|nr:VOC family protein [Janthinobacterium fluminis]MDC8760520.1 VOC family protein [Janthinobacterium fluminis]
MEIDHIFIRVRRGAPEAEALRQFGLAEGSANVHTGQGTANRRFFFHNAFIELLWLDDAAQAQSELTRPTMLFERLGGDAPRVSPFGLCFRPSAPGDKAAPFPSWPYRPVYLPPGLAVDIAAAPLSEPMWFFLSFGARPDAAAPTRRQPLLHRAGLREITSLRLTAPAAGAPSAAAVAAGIETREGAAHLLEIGFDGEGAGRAHDFRPALPLLLRW